MTNNTLTNQMENTVEAKMLTGERAMFFAHDSQIQDCTFADGESPLKHASDIDVAGTNFRWKYPMWYAENVKVADSVIFKDGRAGIWYTKDITVRDTVIEAPKNFRRCTKVALENVDFTDASETLWHCSSVALNNVRAKGDYFLMDSSDLKISHLTLVGNYPFDGVKNAEIRSSRLISKDAFWNAENITIYDSYISGEYFGWNSRNITLVNCTVESHQGFCYIDNLVMKNCKILNTDLAFEYSRVDIESTTPIQSVKNPLGGTIRAPEIEEIIMEEERVDTSRTTIITGAKHKEGEK